MIYAAVNVNERATVNQSMEDNMTLTDEQFFATSRTVAMAILAAAEQKKLSSDDVVAIASSALSEILAQNLGVFGTVERLRDLADVFERQALDAQHS